MILVKHKCDQCGKETEIAPVVGCGCPNMCPDGWIEVRRPMGTTFAIVCSFACAVASAEKEKGDVQFTRYAGDG